MSWLWLVAVQSLDGRPAEFVQEVTLIVSRHLCEHPLNAERAVTTREQARNLVARGDW